MLNNNDLCVIAYPGEGKKPEIYTFCTPETAEEAKQKAYNYYNQHAEDCGIFADTDARDPDYWRAQAEAHANKRDTIQVVSFDDFMKIERAILLAGEPEETTEEQFEEMLDVLPPAAWCTIDGVEMFCMSEMYTGSYTTQYAHDRETNKFYCKMVDILDRTTWINNFLKRA